MENLVHLFYDSVALHHFEAALILHLIWLCHSLIEPNPVSDDCQKSKKHSGKVYKQEPYQGGAEIHRHVHEIEDWIGFKFKILRINVSD